MTESPKPHILYNASSARVGGGLSYATSQINAIWRNGTLDMDVLTAPWNHEAISARCPQLDPTSLVATKANRPSTRFLWEQVRLPVLARRFDALVCPGNFAPILRTVPTVTVLQNPNYVGDGRKATQNQTLSRRAKILTSHLGMMRSNHVVLISHSLASEFEKEPHLRKLPHSVVVSGAADPTPPASSTSSDLVPLLPYVLSVANDYEHKNLVTIVEAWRRHRDESTTPLALVMVGYLRPGSPARLRDASGPFASDLHLLSSVADPDVVKLLYQRAAVTVSASSLEAFPLTPHEAGAQGSPLALSDIPPHREVAAGHAHFFPVGDVAALSRAISDAASSPRPDPWGWSQSWDDHARAIARAICSSLSGAGANDEV